MKRSSEDNEGQFGPEYPRELGRNVTQYRTATRRVGLRALSADQRRAYGEAVAAAIRNKQANELRRANGSTRAPRCASGTWHTTGKEIHEAIRRAQINALLSCPSQERRARTDEQWRMMYEEAMAEKRAAIDCKASPQTEKRKDASMNGKLSPTHQALVDQTEPIPEILRVENRKPITKKEDARLRAELTANTKADRNSTKPTNEADERAIAELLAQQQQTRKQKADARVAALKEKQAQKPVEQVTFERSLKRKQKQQEKQSKEHALRAMRERIAQQESTTTTTKQESKMSTSAKKAVTKKAEKKSVAKSKAKATPKKAARSSARAPVKKTSTKVRSPSGMVVDILKLASRKNGVSPTELNELTKWKGAPWKWLFSNPKETGYCDRWGYDFEVLKTDDGVRYKTTKK